MLIDSNSINISSDYAQLLSNENIQIESGRLLLRNLNFSDIDSIVSLADNYCIAEMMNGSIPYPYPIDVAKDWIAKHVNDSSHSLAISWGIVLKENEELVGSIQLRLSQDRGVGRLSYWIGSKYWNQGYASEAGKLVVQYGFIRLGLKEIQAEHFKRNPASGAVLKKIGFCFIGEEIREEKLQNKLEYFEQYAMIKDEFIKNRSNMVPGDSIVKFSN